MLRLDITGFTEAEVMSLIHSGLEQRKLALQTTIANIEAQLGGKAKPTKAAKPANGSVRRPMSPEARARIVAAQQKRWAKVRKEAKAAEKAAAAPKAPKAPAKAAPKPAPRKRAAKPAGSPPPTPEVALNASEA